MPVMESSTPVAKEMHQDIGWKNDVLNCTVYFFLLFFLNQISFNTFYLVFITFCSKKGIEIGAWNM